MIKKIDGIFNNAVTDITVVTATFGSRSGFADDNWLSQIRI